MLNNARNLLGNPYLSFFCISKTATEIHWFVHFISYVSFSLGCSISSILSRASGMGSPTNHPGSGQRQDTGPGILWWTKPNYLKIWKKMNGPYIRPVLLRQGEPGTSQYITPDEHTKNPLVCNTPGYQKYMYSLDHRTSLATPTIVDWSWLCHIFFTVWIIGIVHKIFNCTNSCDPTM